MDIRQELNKKMGGKMPIETKKLPFLQKLLYLFKLCSLFDASCLNVV